MHTITYLFTPLDEPLNGRLIHAKGLHDHATPKPFSLVPLYDAEGCLAGIRLSALTDQAATLFQRTGEWFAKTGRPCHLGGHEFVISECRTTPGLNWQ